MSEQPNAEHFARLECMYRRAPCNDRYDVDIEIGQGTSTVTLEVEPELFHAARAVHGSYYFKLLDDAAFFAANSLVEGYFVLTVSMNVDFMLGVTEGVMRGVGEVKHFGRRLIFADSTVYDRRNRVVARGSGVFVRSNVQLEDIDGYADRPR